MPEGLHLVESQFYEASPENRPGPLRQILDQRAVGAFENTRRTPEWELHANVHVSGLAKAVLLMMVKDEDEIILQNLEHHYRLGFRRVFILDNGSTDGTAVLIKAFRDAHTDCEIFYAYDFVVGYYQADKMKALEAFVSSYLRYEDIVPEWIFFVDADEFICCCARDSEESVARFNHLLRDDSKNLLAMHWSQCSSREVLEQVQPGYDVFAEFPEIWSRMDPPVPKVAYRLHRGLSPVQGNHLVTSYPYDLASIGVLAEIGFYMLHFPQRTVAQLRRKVVNGANAYKAAKHHEGHGGHWRTYNEWYERSGDAALIHLLRDHIASCTEAHTAVQPTVPSDG